MTLRDCLFTAVAIVSLGVREAHLLDAQGMARQAESEGVVQAIDHLLESLGNDFTSGAARNGDRG